MAAPSVAALQDVATQLRIDSVASTSHAGSGHPTTCLSAADIMAVLFFSEMRFDPKNPQNPDNDRFVLSKGHAAPILYAAWAEAGLFPREQLMELTGCPAWAAEPALAELRERRWVTARDHGRMTEYRLKPIDMVTRPAGWAFGPNG